jgi:hypothetical protein
VRGGRRMKHAIKQVHFVANRRVPTKRARGVEVGA